MLARIRGLNDHTNTHEKKRRTTKRTSPAKLLELFALIILAADSRQRKQHNHLLLARLKNDRFRPK